MMKYDYLAAISKIIHLQLLNFFYTVMFHWKQKPLDEMYYDICFKYPL